MKKTIAISLLFAFLTSNTELHQLLKLPVLIHHFMEHHDQDHHESFADFLKKHYADNPNHSDNHHHDNLPFKTNECATMHNSTVAYYHQHHFSFCQPMIVFKNISVTSKVEFSSSAFLSSIWQPPKIS